VKLWIIKKRRLARWRIHVNDLKLALRNHSGSWRPYTIRSARRRVLLCIYVHIRLFVEKFQRCVGSRVLTIRSGSLCYMHDPILAKAYFCSLRVCMTRVCPHTHRYACASPSQDSYTCRTPDMIFHRNLYRVSDTFDMIIFFGIRKNYVVLTFFLSLKTFQKVDAILYAVRIDVYTEKRCCITLANSNLIENNLVKSVTVLMKKICDDLL